MSKLAPTSTKYIIKAQIKAKGVIEKPDVIGAVFGQTEGLLGSDLDLRELQRTGRIGRIEVKIKSVSGSSEGEIIIPSSLDAAETSLIAATLETIERIGPCTANIKLISVEDTRSDKRKYVVDKAKDILKGLMDAGVPNADEVSEEIKEAVRTHEITSYHGLPCGPNLLDSDNIIIVEGRADILNLLKYGIRNTIAIEGTSISQEIIGLSKEKVVTLFVDGDRGGKLIAKEIMQKADVDYIATAPEGKEVEELSKKEIYKALREKAPAEQFKTGVSNSNKSSSEKPKKHAEPSKEERKHKPFARSVQKSFARLRPRTEARRLKPSQRDLFKKTLEELVGTRGACIFDENNELLGKVPVTELINTIKRVENPFAIVFDGVVDFKLNYVAKSRGVKFLIGMEKQSFSSPITILCRKDLEK